MAVTQQTRVILSARSGNECALCHRALVEHVGDHDDLLLGEVAHIVAQSRDGPRGAQLPPGGNVDGPANLLLLCPTDHARIDDAPDRWSVEALVALKSEHEAAVDARRGGRPAPDRLERLERLGIRSRARSIDRWQALGVTADLAGELADDPLVGDAAVTSVCARSGPVVVLVGDVGAGKSLVGERAHLSAIAAARENVEAPAPVWLRAQDIADALEPTVRHAAEALGDDIDRHGVQLVLDGLDEPGPAIAAELLRAARQLVLALPNSRALLTTRMLPDIGGRDEQMQLPPLGLDETRTLVNRVAGRRQVWDGRWPRTVTDAARRPGFAVALGAVLRDDDRFRPSAPAEVIDRVVQRAIGHDLGGETRQGLDRLAVLSLKAGGQAVRTAAIARRSKLPALLATRLVVEERGRLRFPLILIAQWFAAVALAEEQLDIGELDGATDLELWRYPLAIAVTIAADERADVLLAWLVARSPALTSLVLGDSQSQFARTGASLGNWQAVGAALQAAASGWTRALGSLGPRVAPVDGHGAVCRVAVRVRGRHLEAGWYDGAGPGESVTELTDAQLDALMHDTGPITHLRSADAGDAPGWAWRWTHHELSAALSHLLSERALPLAGTPLEAEAVWSSALVAVGTGSLDPGPIDITALLESDATLRVGTVYGFARVPLPASLRDGLGHYADADGLLHCPVPGPDRRTGGSYVWSDFSPERVRDRAHAAYEMALAGYAHFAETLFAALAPRMRLAVILPASLELDVRMRDSPSGELGAGFEHAFEPLVTGPSRVVSHLNSPRRDDDSRLADNDRRIAELRPQAARWLSAAWHVSFKVDMFGSSPATQLMYEWLWADLAAIGWVHGRLKDRPVARLSCLTDDDWIDELVLRDSSFGWAEDAAG